MRMRFWSALFAIGSMSVSAIAIAPDAPTRPETEFRVLPAQAQEFFQSEVAGAPSMLPPCASEPEQLTVAPREVRDLRSFP